MRGMVSIIPTPRATTTLVILCGALAVILIFVMDLERATCDGSRSEGSESAITSRSERRTASESGSGVALRSADAIRPRPFDPRWDADQSPASRPPEPTGSITLHVIWLDDKSPAAGVGVHVVEFGARSGLRKHRDFRTEADGSLRIDGVIAGAVEISADRGGSTVVQLAAKMREDVTLEIPTGRTVAGTVVDEDDEPVPGAEIWMWTNGSRREGTLVTRTDADGAFSIRSVSPDRVIGARERAHAPSSSIPIREAEGGEPLTIALRLGGRPASVSGTVMRTDGSPVSGATIQIEPDFGAGSALGTTITSGEWGDFRADGLQAGSNVVVVCVEGQIAWSESLYVAPGDRTSLAVVINRGVDVAGTVRTSVGKPIAGVVIRAGGGGGVRAWATTSAADGSFRLEGLNSGPIKLSAGIPDEPELRVSATLDGADGEVVRWDLTMNPAPRIFGFVRDEHGRPLPGWRVDALINGADVGGHISFTDSEGRFEVRRCAVGSIYRIVARLKHCEPPQAILDGVIPGDEERVLRVNLAALVTIRGRILGPSGEPEGAAIQVLGAGGPMAAIANSDTGVFSFGPVVPGRFRILVTRPPVGIQDLGEHELAAGAALDLGDVRLTEMGRLVVDLGNHSVLTEGMAYLISARLGLGGGRATEVASILATPEDLARPIVLAPGSYSIELGAWDGSSWATERRSQTFEISAGGETRIRLSLEPR